MSDDNTPTNPAPNAGRSWTVAIPPEVQIEADVCLAIDRLDTSLKALRMALEAFDKAPGLLGLPDERGHRTEACELRSQWYAAGQLLHAAVATTEAHGRATISVVKDMLSIE